MQAGVHDTISSLQHLRYLLKFSMIEGVMVHGQELVGITVTEVTPRQVHVMGGIHEHNTITFVGLGDYNIGILSKLLEGLAKSSW